MTLFGTLEKLSEALSKKLPKAEGNRRDFLKVLVGGGIATRISASEARTNYSKIPVPDVGYKQIVKDYNLSLVELAHKSPNDYQLDAISRIQRTERWRNIIEAVENRFSIPQGIIYAVVMNESYGDPLQPNATNDGGLGLVHFQPGTALAYGLNIFGNSRRRGRDQRHGRQLADMLRECKYEIRCVLEEDDRAHPIKNLDAIARYLKDGFSRKGSWDGAIQTINPKGRGYAKRIFKWRNAARVYKRAAERDFNERNRGKRVNGDVLTFDYYIKSFLDMNKNYGLDEYKKLKKIA